jgi:hypothetical protein
MASMAYSTWKIRPSGEKVLTPRSYSLFVAYMLAPLLFADEEEVPHLMMKGVASYSRSSPKAWSAIWVKFEQPFQGNAATLRAYDKSRKEHDGIKRMKKQAK